MNTVPARSYVSLAVTSLILVAGCHHKAAVTTPTPDAFAESAVTAPMPELKKEVAVAEPFPAPSVNSQSEVSPAMNTKLETIYFDFDKSDLREDDRRRLQENAAWLKTHPKDRIVIAGNCDERGTIGYNIALGDRRASAARRYLINLGIDPSRIQTVSYGKERPVDPGHDEVAWAKNRRDDFSHSK